MHSLLVLWASHVHHRRSRFSWQRAWILQKIGYTLNQTRRTCIMFSYALCKVYACISIQWSKGINTFSWKTGRSKDRALMNRELEAGATASCTISPLRCHADVHLWRLGERVDKLVASKQVHLAGLKRKNRSPTPSTFLIRLHDHLTIVGRTTLTIKHHDINFMIFFMT